MINKSDLVLLLTELDLPDTEKDIMEIYKTPDIPINILKKINEARPLDLLQFYEKLRASYNKKRSKLYINIMRSNENLIEDTKTVLTTLSSLLNQILQFECENKGMFYKHARADEILKVLNIYFNTYNIEPAYKLLTLVKTDIKCLDLIK